MHSSGIDKELLDVLVVGLVGGRVDAVDRTDLDARVVLLADARLGDHVCQVSDPFLYLVVLGAGRPGAGAARSRHSRVSGDDPRDRRNRDRGQGAPAAAARARRRRPRPGPRSAAARAGCGSRSGSRSATWPTSPTRESLRQALRGVDTVIHLAAAIRDQPRPPVEELNGLATARLLRAAEAPRVERFVFFSAIGATEFQRTRFFRAKALAERAVASSELQTTIFAPSIVYDRDDPWVTIQRRLALLPAIPISGAGKARFEPIWADDVAACVRRRSRRAATGSRRHELAGPELLSYEQIARLIARAAGPRAAARPRSAGAGPRSASTGAATARRRRRLRHLGGGRADGGADGRRRTGPPTSARSASSHGDGRGARRVGLQRPAAGRTRTLRRLGVAENPCHLRRRAPCRRYLPEFDLSSTSWSTESIESLRPQLPLILSLPVPPSSRSLPRCHGRRAPCHRHQDDCCPVRRSDVVLGAPALDLVASPSAARTDSLPRPPPTKSLPASRSPIIVVAAVTLVLAVGAGAADAWSSPVPPATRCRCPTPP